MAKWEQRELRLQKRFARNVRAIRDGADLTIERAAERAEMHPRHWQKIEAGEVGFNVRTITRVALALRVDAAELLRST